MCCFAGKKETTKRRKDEADENGELFGWIVFLKQSSKLANIKVPLTLEHAWKQTRWRGQRQQIQPCLSSSAFPFCVFFTGIFFPFQKGLLCFSGLCLGLQIVAFVNNVHKEGLLNSCWVIFVLHFAPSVNTGTTPTPFPDEPNLAVKAENVTQLHPIFRTCNEENM